MHLSSALNTFLKALDFCTFYSHPIATAATLPLLRQNLTKAELNNLKSYFANVNSKELGKVREP